MSQSETISDEMKKFINLKTRPKIYTVDRHSVERFAEAIGDDNPIYFNEAYAKKTMGGLIAQPTYVRLLRPNKLDQELNTIQTQNRLLKSNKRYIEKTAREEYFYIYPGEIIVSFK